MTAKATTAPAQATAEAASDKDTTEEPTSRAEAARAIVKRNTYWAVGAGLVPIPGADFVAMTAVQLKMLKELSNLYQLRFFDDKAKKLIGALITGTGSVAVAGLVAGSIWKVVPVVGQVVGFVGVPALSGALTQAVGKIFIMHFESGGTLLNFDVEKMREYFHKELASAKESVKSAPAEKEKEKKSGKHASP